MTDVSSVPVHELNVEDFVMVTSAREPLGEWSLSNIPRLSSSSIMSYLSCSAKEDAVLGKKEWATSLCVRGKPLVRSSCFKRSSIQNQPIRTQMDDEPSLL